MRGDSQVPHGEHNGRQVYYMLDRYRAKPDGNRYPVLDLVVCHGSFLNADDTHVHKNRIFRGFGSYGDILVRDRKMYVAPTRVQIDFCKNHVSYLTFRFRLWRRDFRRQAATAFRLSFVPCVPVATRRRSGPTSP